MVSYSQESRFKELDSATKKEEAGTKVLTPSLFPYLYSQNVLQKAEATSTSRKMLDQFH